jgi:predicted Fe-Mo cluster-binding NifX family protein
MKIVVSAESNLGLDSQVAHHFGRCPFFAVVEVADKEVQSIDIIENPYFESHQPGQVPGLVKEKKADVMLSGGMGRRAIQFFNDFGIETATGATGTVQDAVNAYLAGKLRGASSCADSEAHHHRHGHDHGHDHE